MRKLLFLLCLLMVSNNVLATDFWDNLDYAITDEGGDVKSIDATLFGARATSSWLDSNNNNKLDDDETILTPVVLYDRSGNMAIASPDNVTTRDGIESWSEEHAAEIMDTVFQGSISGSSSGISDDQVLGQVTLSNILFPAGQPVKKVSVAAKATDNVEPKIDSMRSALEYTSLKVNGDKGAAYSLLLGYVNEFDDAWEAGFYVPYRYSKIDDDINTRSHYFGCLIYAKKTVEKWDKQEIKLNIGGDIFGSGYLVESDAIDYAGNLKYGGGLFTTIEKNMPIGLLTFGFDYKWAKAYVNSSWISTDNEFVKEAIDWVNDLDPVNTLTYGVSLQVPFEKAKISTEIYRSNFISDDIESGRDSQTTVGVSATYFMSDTFEINLGTKGVFELDDVDQYSVTFGTILRF